MRVLQQGGEILDTSVTFDPTEAWAPLLEAETPSAPIVVAVPRSTYYARLWDVRDHDDEPLWDKRGRWIKMTRPPLLREHYDDLNGRDRAVQAAMEWGAPEETVYHEATLGDDTIIS